MRSNAEWAIDSQAIRARGIIVLVKSNYRVFQKFVPIESCTLYETFYVSLGKIQLGQLINLSN